MGDVADIERNADNRYIPIGGRLLQEDLPGHSRRQQLQGKRCVAPCNSQNPNLLAKMFPPENLRSGKKI